MVSLFFFGAVGVVVLSAAIIAAMFVASRRGMRGLAIAAGAFLLVAGVLACAMSKDLAILSLGGTSAAMDLVMFVDMNAVSNAQMKFLIGGGLAALLGTGSLVVGALMSPTRRAEE